MTVTLLKSRKHCNDLFSTHCSKTWHEPTKEENAEFEEWLEKYNIPDSNVIEARQECKFTPTLIRGIPVV